MNLETGLLACFRQGLEEVLPVHVAGKNALPPVATAHHVVNGTWIYDSQLPWHGRNIPEGHLIVKQTL